MDIILNCVHSLDEPKKEDNKGVIILMHGYGGDAKNSYMSFSKTLPSNYFIVSVDAPFKTDFRSGNAWCDIYYKNGIKLYNLEELEKSRTMLIEFIDYIKTNYEIDSSNIILFGHSQGSVLSQLVSVTRPDLIRGTIATSGFMLEEVINGDIPIEDVKGLEMFIGHGSLDPQVPVEKDQKGKEYLESIGVDLEYREYTIGHTISNEELVDINNWIKKLK